MKYLAVALAGIALIACSKNIQTKEAVKEAIVDYLTARQGQTGINMSAMNVEVVNMNFQSDRAQVTVAFNLKTGEGGMQMGYDLERQGNKWIVKGSTPRETPQQALPPDHPSIGSGQLPPGHPAVGSKE